MQRPRQVGVEFGAHLAAPSRAVATTRWAGGSRCGQRCAGRSRWAAAGRSRSWGPAVRYRPRRARTGGPARSSRPTLVSMKWPAPGSVEPADRAPRPFLGPHGVGVGLLRVGVALPVAVRDEHGAARPAGPPGRTPSSQGASAHTAVDVRSRPAAPSAARPPIECPSRTTGTPGWRSAELVAAPTGRPRSASLGRGVPAAVRGSAAGDGRGRGAGEQRAKGSIRQVGQPACARRSRGCGPARRAARARRPAAGSGWRADRLEAGQSVVRHGNDLTTCSSWHIGSFGRNAGGRALGSRSHHECRTGPTPRTIVPCPAPARDDRPGHRG